MVPYALIDLESNLVVVLGGQPSKVFGRWQPIKLVQKEAGAVFGIPHDLESGASTHTALRDADHLPAVGGHFARPKPSEAHLPAAKCVHARGLCDRTVVPGAASEGPAQQRSDGEARPDIVVPDAMRPRK